jgi:hypothetical protein
MGLFSFGKKPQPADRYAGKPFLKLVDSFVLKCIDELDPAQEALLVQMTPRFQGIYSSTGSWDQIVQSEMHFPPNIRSLIRELWAKNQAIATTRGEILAPMRFVEMFVENNVPTS